MPAGRIEFVPITPQAIVASTKTQKQSKAGKQRESIGTELRGDIQDDLKRRANDESALMSYTLSGHAELVSKYRLKLVGWPADIPFTNLGELLGGVKTMETLSVAWRKHILCFERATDEEVANAARDPLSVHPNPALVGETSDAEDERMAREGGGGARRVRRGRGTIVEATVRHPGTLDVLGVLQTSTQPSVDLAGRAHEQRSDMGTLHDGGAEPERPRKRRRDGIKSQPGVLEGGVGQPADGYWLVNERLGELRPAGSSRAAEVRGSVSGTSSDARSDLDEIESASGLPGGEAMSEIEEF